MKPRTGIGARGGAARVAVAFLRDLLKDGRDTFRTDEFVSTLEELGYSESYAYNLLRLMAVWGAVREVAYEGRRKIYRIDRESLETFLGGEGGSPNDGESGSRADPARDRARTLT